MIAKCANVRFNILKPSGEIPLKTLAGRKSTNNDDFSRRRERARELSLVSTQSPRRFRIAIADNLFKKQPEFELTDEPNANAIAQTDSDFPGFDFRTELLIGLAAVAGLTIGYFVGRRRL
ncbi:MAG: hypothetical protein DMF63_03680 [Acidobacteria bacterium]|nr:MAG: hypothetical protein DMF63_03680 [Acidobacteriota bacterium]